MYFAAVSGRDGIDMVNSTHFSLPDENITTVGVIVTIAVFVFTGLISIYGDEHLGGRILAQSSMAWSTKSATIATPIRHTISCALSSSCTFLR